MTTDESTAADPSEHDGSSRHPGMVRVRVRVRRSRRRRRRLIALAVLVLVVAAVVVLALMARSLVSAKHEAKAAQADLTAANNLLAARPAIVIW